MNTRIKLGLHAQKLGKDIKLDAYSEALCAT
jgi:hypothetical protein